MSVSFTTPNTTLPGANVHGAESSGAPKAAHDAVKTKGLDKTVLFEDVEGDDKTVDREMDDIEVPVPVNVAEAKTSAAVYSLTTTVQADIYAFMHLMQQMLQTMRTSDKELRHAETQAGVAELMSGAKEMEEAAGKRLSAAQTQAWFAIGAGTATAVAGGVSAFGTYKSAQYSKQGEAATLSGDMELASSHNASASNWGNLARTSGTVIGSEGGLSGATQGFGRLLAASDNASAEKHDAEKLKHEAASRVHEQESADAQTRAQQYLDMIRDLQGKLSTMEQSNSDTIRNAVRS